jgi:acid phosphatase type 7
VLDSNPYIDWTDPKLVTWLKSDLHAARNASWRFVTFHHPGFSSSKAHADDQRMRVLAPTLEAGKVQLVFNGHVHNYQRTHPLRFQPAPTPSGTVYGPGGRVEGRWTLDHSYNGSTQTRPDGTIYLVTGAGGARLYDSAQEDDLADRLPFTARFLSKVYSLTVVDVTPESVTVRQVSADGVELDRFVLTH